jgi:indole-3-acetate monooxygenase
MPIVDLDRATTPSVGLILDAVTELLPEIRNRRGDIERARRLPQDLVERLAATGMNRLGIPRDLGGEQAHPHDLMEVIERVSTADGSTGWCAMIAVANSTSSGFMSPQAAQEMFADPAAPTAGIAAPAGAATRVQGGLRVSGRWSFASGITHSRWLWAGCMIMEDGNPRMTEAGPEIVQVCLPVDDVTVHDTWDVSGMCGTGSNDFSVDDVFVPDHRVFLLLDPRQHRPEPLYQMPPVGTFAAFVACVSLGLARGALDEIVTIAPTKVPTFYIAPLAERPALQIELARAEAALAAARAFLYEAVAAVFTALDSKRAPTSSENASLRLAAVHAAETGADITRRANVLAGGSAIYARSATQRHARDAEVILHHFTVAPHVWEEAGRLLLGQPLNVPAF